MAQPDWKRNLYVCVAGSFVNIVAMTLLLPFLPLYAEQLGAQGHAAIVLWSGIAYGATFLAAALVAPLWGRVSDRYGCKPNLVRASAGMTISIGLMGLATSVWQLVALRVLVGLAGGYTSGAAILVARQAPREKSAWALGTLSAGIMAGSLAGPLVGGVLPQWIGIRNAFFLAGACILLNLLATTFLVREERPARAAARSVGADAGFRASLADPRLVGALLATAALLMVANMSIEPIITVYVQQLVAGRADVPLSAGAVMSIAALGSILSAAALGRLADRIGPRRVIPACLATAAALLVPQAFVTGLWQLAALRFLMGLALGGLLPSITALIRQNVPDGAVGRALGYSTGAQYLGQVLGPLLGGFVGGHAGVRPVFLATSALLAGAAAYHWAALRKRAPAGNAAESGIVAGKS